MSTLRTYIGDKLVAFGAAVAQPYQRPSNYPSITEPTASEEKAVMLMRLFKPFGTGDSARNMWYTRLRSTSNDSFTVTGSDGTSQTLTSGTNTFVVFDYDNATSYAVDVNSAASGTSYYIEDLGNTSQTDWNTLAGTTGVTYAVGDSFETAVAGSTLSDSTGTVSIYNFRHVVVTITGTNWHQAMTVSSAFYNTAIEEVYLSMPNYNSNNEGALSTFFRTNPNRYLAYVKLYTTFSSITDAADWFNACEGLVEFDCPSNFLPNCTRYYQFFSNCRLLTKTSKWDTSSGTSFQRMFSHCRSLVAVPDFDYSAATNMHGTFQNMHSLRVMGNLSLPSATDVRYLFQSCLSLQEVGNVSAPSATTARNMFQGCYSVKKIGTITLTSSTDFYVIFSSCQTLKTIDGINFPTSGSINFSQAYRNCYLLEVAYLPPSTVSYSSFDYMMDNTASLERIEPADLTMDASSITNNAQLRYAFQGSFLRKLPNITFSTSTFTGNTDNHMFQSLRRVQEIPAYDLSAVTAILANNKLFRDSANALNRIKATGIACSFTIQAAGLTADALDELMTNCATVTGKTMNLRNNPGSADCDTTIATNKGWTVLT